MKVLIIGGFRARVSGRSPEFRGKLVHTLLFWDKKEPPFRRLF